MKRHIAVILYNLGGPDSLDAVKPFLFNLFNDKAIITAPAPIRYFIAKLISSRRTPIAQDIYREMGGKSPILEQTQDQAKALQQLLNNHDSSIEWKVHIAMRYWKPFFQDIIPDIQKDKPEEILLLPLYPQFSTTTTGSAMEEWEKQCKKHHITIPSKHICCYYQQHYFIEAVADLIKPMLNEYQATYNQVRILFSAHGLPKKIIDKGDPYATQVETTVAQVMQLLGKQDHVVCYQSRVGPLEWIGPSTEDEIKRAGKDNTAILIVPIAFVSEHSETLVELDIEYKELAEEHGVNGYGRVPTVGCHPSYIEGLKVLAQTLLAQSESLISEDGQQCAAIHKHCPCVKKQKMCKGE